MGMEAKKFYTMVSMGAAVRLLLLHSRQAARKGVCLRFVIDFGGTAWHRSKNRTRLRLRTIRTETVNPVGEKRTRTRRPYYNRRPRRSQQPKEAAVPIHIYPLGGLGEVGKNMTVYECNGDMIIVDCGLVFPDSEMYGVDMVIPRLYLCGAE